jgi:anaerobic ribonucleoside-triphosphate reductase activating protein
MMGTAIEVRDVSNDMTIRIAGIVEDSIVDGRGIRMTIFTQGCPHHCAGCHNPQTHDPSGGTEVEVSEIIEQMRSNPLLDGVTFSGGEPFEQRDAVEHIAHEAHRLRLDVWCYTGWTWEEIMRDPAKRGMLAYIDVLVDGRFVLSQRSLELKWRGSKNQRVIDVAESLFSNKIVELEE